MKEVKIWKLGLTGAKEVKSMESENLWKETWKDKLTEVMKERGDAWENIVHVSLPNPLPDRFNGVVSWHDVDIEDRYFGGRDMPFIVWTHDWVYFPTEYDGFEGVDSMPRNPCDDVGLRHVS